MRLDRELDLIAQMVQAMYDAENQLILALPRVAARAASPDLRASLRDHLEKTRAHAARLAQAAAVLGVPCSGRKSLAMQGLLKDGEQSLGYGGAEVLVDAAIIASCQAVEHFEISQYQALQELCARAGAEDVAGLVEQTLAEEERASRTLAEIAAGSLRSMNTAG